MIIFEILLLILLAGLGSAAGAALGVWFAARYHEKYFCDIAKKLLGANDD